MEMRDLLFAIIPHAGWVNLQLADGALLPNPDGRIEGTGKRIRPRQGPVGRGRAAGWVRAGHRGRARFPHDATEL